MHVGKMFNVFYLHIIYYYYYYYYYCYCVLEKKNVMHENSVFFK